jgi:hypothetical protein
LKQERIVESLSRNRPIAASDKRPAQHRSWATGARAVVLVFCIVAARAWGQLALSPNPAPAIDGPPVPLRPAAPPPHNYVFPDGKQQFRNYLDSIFGPAALTRVLIGATLDQAKPAPPEWDPGVKGFSERLGSRFGMDAIAETARYSGGALLHQDVAYHKCACTGFIPRSAHALVSSVTARSREGRTILSLPSIVAPYAGSFAAVNAWYPARYEAADAFRIGSLSFAFRAGMNLAREFLLPSR